MLVLPLMAIAIMLIFSLWSIFTMLVLTIRAFTETRKHFLRWAEFWSPLILSTAMLAGLGLLRAFPGLQEAPVEFSNSHFVYPMLLAIAAICMNSMDKNAEQD